MGSLTITYLGTGQRPLSVATIEDEALLHRAGQLALRQAEERAVALAAEDPIMGLLQATEVRRLRAALSILIPGFDATTNTSEGVQ
jgi:hypothetical protein